MVRFDTLDLKEAKALLGELASEPTMSRLRAPSKRASYLTTMKCGTGTPEYSATSLPTNTHKKRPKATLVYQGSYRLERLSDEAMSLGQSSIP